MKAINENINESKIGGYFHNYKICFQIHFERKMLAFPLQNLFVCIDNKKDTVKKV